MELFMQLVGWVLIYAACDVGRGPESKLEFLSWKKALQIALVITGVMIYSHFAIG